MVTHSDQPGSDIIFYTRKGIKYDKIQILYPKRYKTPKNLLNLYPKGYIIFSASKRREEWKMNAIAEFVKKNRKEAGLTQEEFAMRSGLGLRFVRDLEQGKETVRMDKVNVALGMFGATTVPGRKENE